MAATVHLVVRGAIAGSGSWSMSFDSVFAGFGPTLPTQAQLDAYTEAVWADLKTKVFDPARNTLSYMSTSVNATGVSSYLYVNGSAGGAAMNGSSSGSGVVGTGTPVHPPQIALVISKLTAAPGPKGRGRMYLPVLANVTNAVLQTTPVTASNLAGYFSDAFTLINTRALGPTNVGVVSVANPRAGTFSPVTRIRVDTIYDTQRPRADKLLATNRYTVAVVVP